MSKKKEIKKIEFDLLENGLDFILSSLEPIVEPKNEMQLKYSILHLSAGIELVLKERLKQEHWSLIFENTNNANNNDLSSGDFQSVNLETSLRRLINICNISLSEKDQLYLRELKKRRNRIEHFAFKEIDVAIRSLVSKVLSTIFSFIKEHIEEENLSKQSKTQIELLRGRTKDFFEFSHLRLNQIKVELDSAKKDFDIVKCPLCYQESFVLSGEFKCLFCGYTDSSENVAEIYIENIMGLNRYIEYKDGGYFPLEVCPDCGDETLVDDGVYFICFNCLSKWSRKEINECSVCERLYIPEDDDMDICKACSSHRFEKWDEKN